MGGDKQAGFQPLLQAKQKLAGSSRMGAGKVKAIFALSQRPAPV